jgi:enoyl-CoA hydratase/carnithine racemase
VTAPVPKPGLVEELSGGAVRLALSGPVAQITLHRPERLNAIGRATLTGLDAAIYVIESSGRIRVAVLHGAGRAFSAGADLDEVSALLQDRASFNAFLDEWHATLAAVGNCQVPVIAGVHGFAFAGGFELLQVCDLVVVGEHTRIADQHANFGLFPAGGSTQRLPRLIGYRAALWALLSGEEIAPRDALAAGLVNRVVPDEDVLKTALEMADTIAAKSAGGTAAIKAAVRHGRDLDVAAALRAERRQALDHMMSADVQKGLAAFRAHTRPDFSDGKELM